MLSIYSFPNKNKSVACNMDGDWDRIMWKPSIDNWQGHWVLVSNHLRFNEIQYFPFILVWDFESIPKLDLNFRCTKF